MMSEPRLHHVQCLAPEGLHRMAYWEWGQPDNPCVLVCVHGLTRQGRDFDTLARSLCGHYRVVCPDVAGRGRSQWLTRAHSYGMPTYVADMVTLLARLNGAEVHWVGTSMGGLIGLGLAALPDSPIAKLVLNDVGPVIEFAAVERISGYVGMSAHWDSLEQAADQLAAISKGFGPHTREQWLALTRPQIVPDDTHEGIGYKPHYDPAIAVPFREITREAAEASQAAAWASYDAVRCPTLLLRGAESDLLSRQTAQVMTQRGPRAQLHEFAGVGHAPTLVQPDQVEVVSSFLLGSVP